MLYRNRAQIADFRLARTDNLSARANCGGAGSVGGSAAVNASAIDDRQLIGANIRIARRLAGGVGQRALAAGVNQRLGTKFTFMDVSRWENGHRLPSLQTMQAVAVVLGRSRGWFYDEHPELEP
jgi:helix-turn-helix protein